jgi:AcrR family transcriptional regulator
VLGRLGHPLLVGLALEANHEAAQQVFGELGYAATTTNKIAERAGVSIGSLYQYFPNKETILVELLHLHLQASIPLVSAAIENLARPGVSLEQGVKAIFEQVIALHQLSPRLHRLLFDEVPRTEAIVKLHAQAEHQHTQLTREVLERHPEVRKDNLDVAVHVLVQTTEALAHWLVLKAPKNLDRERFIQETVDMMTGFMRIQ